jgi:hypothetical protein
MGHFSVKISATPGSLLSGNQHPDFKWLGAGRLSADHNGKAAQNNFTAMRARVEHARCGTSTN